MKFLNIAAALMLMVALILSLKSSVPPPDDPWFEQAVTRQPRPVLVKFGAEWCPPCRYLEAVLDRVEDRLQGRVKIVRVDVDEKQALARHYGISSIPRLMLFRDGRLVASHGGFADPDALQTWLDRATP